MSDFIHLHVHSHYSLLSALPKIPDLVAEAKKNGMKAIALTDNGNMYGAIEFYKRCEKEEIKPILGVDAYVALRSRKDKQAGIDNKRSRIIFLAKNEHGYKNMIKLVTDSYMEGFYYKPRCDKETIEKFKDDLICIAPAQSSEIREALEGNEMDKAKEIAKWYKDRFDANFYLEITDQPDLEGSEELREKIIQLGKEMNIPLVAGQDIFYLKSGDKKARETLMAVQNGPTRDRAIESNDLDLSFISPKDMEKKFKKYPEAIENTKKIADMCNVTLELGKWVFPDLKVPSGRSYDDELREVTYAGIKKRGIEETKEVVERIEYELDIIKTKGYSPYFLVVADLLRHAHENHILTTIRGSVAGSMVTYLSGITNVNPLVYKLPFERFLNPERPSAPDIDMDYADIRRDEIIQYARDKYGADKVAQIGTFGTMMARGSVRDVARALGFEYSKGDQIAKLIPMGSQGFPMTIDAAMDMIPELKKLYKDDADTKEIIDMAKKIEGCARHISVHAAGVVISPTALTDFVPLQLDTKGDEKIITQYDMHAVEDAGLLKFDFLGIKNLSILADAVERVRLIEKKEVDIENVDIEDKKTFDLLAKGETIGLFQLNGSGMTRYLKELKPTTIFDINAMVALYRPGPMESIPQYVERKHNPSLVKYLDPRMKDILNRSYGVITYQDDVMMIAINLAGYSWLEADKLRKAMGKKIPAEMAAQKEKLLTGFVEHGMTEKKAQELWALIEPFAAYGFNKAHAASYGRVAYQTAFMKANYPAIYMSAVLTADSGDVEKIGEIITECKRMNIPVLPPDINESYSAFSVVRKEDEPDKIRFGLTTIKNFGEGISKVITGERKENGKFKNLANFLERIQDRNLNKKSLEALIKSGALDAFGERGAMLFNMDKLLEYNKTSSHAKNQDTLFGAADINTHDDIKLEQADSASAHDKLLWEKELLGLYISGHPMDKYREVLDSKINIEKVKSEGREGFSLVVGGVIEDIRPIITKKGDQMVFLKLADFNDALDVVVFPKVYTEYQKFLEPEKCIAIKGRVSNRNGEKSLIAEKIKQLA